MMLGEYPAEIREQMMRDMDRLSEGQAWLEDDDKRRQWREVLALALVRAMKLPKATYDYRKQWYQQPPIDEYLREEAKRINPGWTDMILDSILSAFVGFSSVFFLGIMYENV